MRINALLLVILLCLTSLSYAQNDSGTISLKYLPTKYLNQVDKKIDKYTKRITSTTEKTLTKLSRWENKIKTILLKASPATAQQLFAPGIPTFSAALEKYKAGQSIAENYKAQYDAYRDNLSTGLKFLEAHKADLDSNVHKQLAVASLKNAKLTEELAETESLTKFIRDRKKLLIDQSLKHIGKSKYLQKINKESFYYFETLKNYKEIFSDKKKAEETALAILNKIPAFEKFFKQNSMLSSLFKTPGNYGTPQALAGLQTRASVNSLIQDRIAAGGPNAREAISQNMQAAQAEINKLKDKLIKSGATNSAAEMPDFKPNMQKTKTFMQRLEFGSNFQFGKRQSFMPANADLGLQAGFKLNEKSLIGIGASYKLGMGRIEKIRFTHEGIGVRSFVDLKLKKQFYLSGGYEMNHKESFEDMHALQDAQAWQKSGLLGLSKKVSVKNKFVKGSQLQLLYDFLYNTHSPASQPIVFRIGYSFH